MKNTRDQEGGLFILAIGGGPEGYLRRINPWCADVRIRQERKITVGMGQQFSVFLANLTSAHHGN